MNTKLNEARHQFTEAERANRAGKSFGLNSRTNKELSKLQPMFIAHTREYFREWCKTQRKSYTYYYKYSELLTFAEEVKDEALLSKCVRDDYLVSLIENLVKEVQELKEEVKALREEKPRSVTKEEPPVTTDAVSDAADLKAPETSNPLELCTEEEIDFLRSPAGREFYDTYKETGTFDLSKMRKAMIS